MGRSRACAAGITMTYSVKEIFYTLQGEGAQTGRAAVFCRFSGCNLWSGLEKDRASAVCNFCDTDFVGVDGLGGGKFKTAQALAAMIASQWPTDVDGVRYVVCTGGEPLLQLDEALINALHDLEFEVAVETNGTIKAPAGIDWICVSPKADAKVVQQSGNELKLVFPQEKIRPEDQINLDFDHFFLQPMDGDNVQDNTRATVEYCMAHPKWRVSLQTHKVLKIA